MLQQSFVETNTLTKKTGKSKKIKNKKSQNKQKQNLIQFKMNCIGFKVVIWLY